MKKGVYLTRQRVKILRALAETNRPMTALEISQRSGVARDTTRISLPRLVDHGWVQATPIPPQRNKGRRYSLPPHMREYVLNTVLADRQ